MIKSILVVSTGNDSDTATYNAALALARQSAAHIDVLHVRLDAATIAVGMATDAGSGALTAGLIDQLEADAGRREAGARELFDQFCRGAGLAVTAAPGAGAAAAPSAAFHVETGEEARWTAVYGMTADLVLAPRRSSDDTSARATLEAALLDSGRPVLIPAATALPAAFDRIAIGWKPTREAARAVALALPFLTRAREIVVLTVAERPAEGEGREAADEAAPLLRSLGWHGLAVRAERLTPGADGTAATLLAAARQRADLLVMGGYGHSRLREWVFGGFTEHVLADAPLPVLLAH